MYKIVDTFNGWEPKEQYQTVEDAEQALDADMAEFLESPYCIGGTYEKEIVPAEYKWSFERGCWGWS